MAIKAHQMLAWVWQGSVADKRTGLINMTRAEFLAYGNRAQDPRVGALHLKHISRTLFDPGVVAAAAVPRRRPRATQAAEE